MPFSSQDAERVRVWSTQIRGDIEIHFLRTGDERSDQIEAYLDELWRLAPAVRVVVDEEEGVGLPAIVLSDNLHIQAIPSGLELQPFLDLLAETASPRTAETADETGSPGPFIEWPAAIRIYISPHCPHCPGAVSQIAPLALQHPNVTVTVIDGGLFPELAQREGVRSAPTVLLDESFRWTGVPPRQDLMRALHERDPALLSAESLKRMLKDGQAGRLAEMMVEGGRVFPELQRLIDHPEWSVRLGAVVVTEELAEQNRELARMILEPVWERFAQLDPSVQGDVVYLSGLVGTPDWIPRLAALLREDVSDEMQEVVTEALESLGYSFEES